TDVNSTSGSTVSNTATAVGTTADSNSANNSGTATTVITVSADLAITKSESPNPVNAGQQATYTLTITNNGPNPAVNTMVTDVLPSQVTFVSATSNHGPTPTQAGGIVTASLGTMAPGDVATVTIIVMVNSNVPPGTTLTNQASVSSNTPDSNPAN